MKKQSCIVLLAAAALMATSSCKEELSYPVSPKEIASDFNARFDFNTWDKLPVTINIGREAYVRIYDCDPDVYQDADPVFTAFTDKVGYYNGVMEVGHHLVGKTLWAVCHGVKVQAQLSAKGVTFVNNDLSRALDTGATELETIATTLNNKFHDQLPEGHNNSGYVSEFLQGRINIVVTKDNTEIMTTMMDYGDQLGLRIYYYYYPSNSTLKASYSTPAAFYSAFVQDKFKISPNGDGWATQGLNGTSYDQRSTRLQYYGSALDETGSYKFPNGVTVGFCVLVNSAAGTYLTFTDAEIGAIKVSDGKLSNEGSTLNIVSSWDDKNKDVTNNPRGNANVINYAAGFGEQTVTADPEAGNDNIYRLVYGFEDYPGGYDLDYDDLMFMVTVEGGMTDLPTPNRGVRVKKGTYLFEDLYPDHGDYDMNDVIIKYKYYAYYTVKTEGDATPETIDMFTYSFEPVWDGATYINDFYIAYEPIDGGWACKKVYENNKAVMAASSPTNQQIFAGFAYLPGGQEAPYGSDDFAKSFIGQSANVANLWSWETEETTDELNGEKVKIQRGLNPFIYVHNTDSQVHLSKHAFVDVTGYGGDQAPGTENTGSVYLKYYLTDLKSGTENFPFAMDIAYDNFDPVTESVKIFEEYLPFAEWVSSKGVNATNWYEAKSN